MATNGSLEVPSLLTVGSPRQEKNGMAFDLGLEPPVDPSKAPSLPTTPRTPRSQEEIVQNLEKAEGRRLSIEQEKVEKVRRRSLKIEQSKLELNERQQAQRLLIAERMALKQERIESNRDTIMNRLQQNIKRHISHVEIVRENLIEQRETLRVNIEQKLTTAEQQREARIKAIQDEVSKHLAHIAEVQQKCEAIDEGVKASAQKELVKLEEAAKKREEHFNEKINKIRERGDRCEQVKSRRSMLNDSRDGSACPNEGQENQPPKA